jgi:hypothetical protein
MSRDSDYENRHAIGIEAEAKGVGTWDGAPIGDYAYLAYVLAKHYGVPTKNILGHKETCSPVGRKSDPLLDMDRLRMLAKPKLVKDNDVDFKDTLTLSEAAARNLGAPAEEGDTVSVATMLLWSYIRATKAEREVKELTAKFDKFIAAQEGK